MYVHIFREKTHVKTSLFPGCEGTFSAGVGRGKKIRDRASIFADSN